MIGDAGQFGQPPELLAELSSDDRAYLELLSIYADYQVARNVVGEERGWRGMVPPRGDAR